MPLYNPPTLLVVPTTLDMAASQSANTTSLALTISNTQANSVIGISVGIGTSGKSQGLLIKGTGSFASSSSELDRHLTIWGNTAANASKVLSIGSGTTYTESWYVLGRGDMIGTNAATVSISSTATTDFNSSPNGQGAKTCFKMTDANNLNFNTIAFDASSTCTAVTSAKTDYFIRGTFSRSVTTAVTVSDDYDALSVTRTSISNNAGATLNATGSVARFANVATQTAGTLADTTHVLELSQDADSTGRVISCQIGTTEHFFVDGATALPGWIAGDTQTTVGAAGGASALPATPTGYLKVKVGSTTFITPYYAAA